MVIRPRSAMAGGLRTFVGLTLLSIGFLATLGTVLGFLGGFWWAFDVLASFRLQYAVVLAVVAIAYGLGFGRASALVFLVAAAVNAAYIAPFYLEEPAEVASTSNETLRIVSFNVGVSNTNREGILEWIAESDADLVFLHETSRDWDGPIASTDLPFTVAATRPADRQFGTTLLSRLDGPVEILRVTDRREQVIRAETAIAGVPVVVYGVHPRSPTNETRAEMRDDLLAEIAVLAGQETVPVVVVGDLNTSPWSAAFHALASDGDLIDSMRGFGVQPSWPASPFVIAVPIDHALHSPQLTTVDRRLGPALGSDHRPLIVEIGPSSETDEAGQ